ncbi:hypothetical protein IG197_19870 [Aminobacter sp. SR38]|jgi:hypothetical protein|uniref:hypothetical protein n=1 Tax=unclassified Aminobacter TaxID=2644704 RepID=UPI0012AF0977|nr:MULTISPECIES: hypothetical protein [unclassified Aminobacter]MRX37064.1 hypothetical protein [Aminobacter sp. MDW-2]QNH35037.1 hypothetical protein H5P29_03640 [Aminobacter sp. MDW-2]QOF70077.1 hypothetical protein IG197_19870 [Aminobacter sp. SR38]
MRKMSDVANWLPALVFVLMAMFLAMRMAVGAFPASEWTWRLYLALAPFGREIGLFFPASFAGGMASVVLALVLATAAAAKPIPARRARFLTHHAALVLLIVALRDEGVFAASSDGAIVGHLGFLPDLNSMSPFFVVLLLGVVWACASTHKAIFWAMIHPVRTLD